MWCIIDSKNTRFIKPFVIFAKQYALFVTKEHESTYNDCDAVCCRHSSNRL